MYQNTVYICTSWYSKICWFAVKKCWCQQNSRGCVTWFIYFLDLLWVRYNCAKFHHCSICVTDFREVGAFLPPPHPWAAPKKPILNRVKKRLWYRCFPLNFCETSRNNFSAEHLRITVSHMNNYLEGWKGT